MNPLFANIPQDDLFGIKTKDGFNYKKMTQLLGFNKRKVAKAAGISESSVRYDGRMPVDLEDFFRELISVLAVVSKQFDGDKQETLLWFNMPNTLLGGLSPAQMITLGKHKKLMKFIQRSIEGNMP